MISLFATQYNTIQHNQNWLQEAIQPKPHRQFKSVKNRFDLGMIFDFVVIPVSRHYQHQGFDIHTG